MILRYIPELRGIGLFEQATAAAHLLDSLGKLASRGEACTWVVL